MITYKVKFSIVRWLMTMFGDRTMATKLRFINFENRFLISIYRMLVLKLILIRIETHGFRWIIIGNLLIDLIELIRIVILSFQTIIRTRRIISTVWI